MATGSTYTFEQGRDEIIKDALANLGVTAPNEAAVGDMLTHGARALNRVVKEMDQAAGLLLWRVVRRTFTTTDGTASYSLAADVLSVDEPLSYLKASPAGRSVLYAMSRDDYMHLPDRTVEGTPVRYFFEKTLANAVLILDPIPDTTGDTVEYAAVIKSRDFGDGDDTPDFPAHWTTTLVYGLTAELAPVYGQAAAAPFWLARFKDSLKTQMQAETEHGNMTLVYGGY